MECHVRWQRAAITVVYSIIEQPCISIKQSCKFHCPMQWKWESTEGWPYQGSYFIAHAVLTAEDRYTLYKGGQPL